MPAAEIVRAVARIEYPLEVDGEDLADRTGLQHFLYLARARGVAVVEGDGEVAARALPRVEDRLAFGGIYGHRLLSDHVAASLHRQCRLRTLLKSCGVWVTRTGTALVSSYLMRP